MSSDAWAIQVMKKYQLAVDFCTQHVECSWGTEFEWGDSHVYDYASFEEALQAAVDYTIKTGR